MAKVKHGSRVEILFGSNSVGVITNFAPNEDTGLQPVYGIGHFHPQELVRTRFSGSFTFSKMVIAQEKVVDSGYVITDEVPLSTVAKSFLEQEGFQIQIKDKYGEKQTFKTYNGCKIGSTGINVTENAIIVENGNGQYSYSNTPAVVKE